MADLSWQHTQSDYISHVCRPPYSSDMAPCDFFLFPKIKNTLKGSGFVDVETIKFNTMQQPL